MRCRFADASFVAVAELRAIALGKLLVTAPFVFSTPPEAPVASATHEWAGTLAFPVLGSAVAKTGMRTGTSHGSVTRTCVDIRLTSGAIATNNIALCQWQARLFAWHGDSGAPIFAPLPRSAAGPLVDARRKVLAGVLSTGPVDDAPKAKAQRVEVTFSPWGSIAAELGGQWTLMPP